jgi:hypothetical protein
MEELLKEHQAARVLQCSVKLLRKLHARREGPARIKIGRCVRYDQGDLRDFLARQRTLAQARMTLRPEPTAHAISLPGAGA